MFFNRLSALLLICSAISSSGANNPLHDFEIQTSSLFGINFNLCKIVGRLHLAIDKNDYDQVLTILKTELGGIDREDCKGNTLLYYAADGNDIRMAKLLIEAGANINGMHNPGRTPLHNAVRKRHEDMVKLLLTAGANVDITDNMHPSRTDGQTPLHYAASENDTRIARLLIEAGADVNARKSSNKNPLHIAIYNKHEDMVKLLLAAGANIDGQPPEHYIFSHIFYSKKNILRLLVESGINISNLSKAPDPDSYEQRTPDPYEQRTIARIVKSVIPKRAKAIRDFLDTAANNSSPGTNYAQGFPKDLQRVVEEFIDGPITTESVQKCIEDLPLDDSIAACADALCLIL